LLSAAGGLSSAALLAGGIIAASTAAAAANASGMFGGPNPRQLVQSGMNKFRQVHHVPAV
jgi:hypothetical protein